MEILIGISTLLNFFLLFACGLMINSLQNEKKDLLDRLMAKDYKEYATFEHLKSAKQAEEEPKTLFEAQDEFPVS